LPGTPKAAISTGKKPAPINVGKKPEKTVPPPPPVITIDEEDDEDIFQMAVQAEVKLKKRELIIRCEQIVNDLIPEVRSKNEFIHKVRTRFFALL
jgi:hypothetical protein